MNNYLEGIFARTCVEYKLYSRSDVNARNCTNTRSAGEKLRRGHMILDHYGFLNLIT